MPLLIRSPRSIVSLREEGVDLSPDAFPRGRELKGLPPRGGSGFKPLTEDGINEAISLPPRGGSGFKLRGISKQYRRLRLPPRGGSGFKLGKKKISEMAEKVSLREEGVDLSLYSPIRSRRVRVSLREEGVDLSKTEN